MRSSTAPRIAHDATVTVEGEAHHPFAARAVNLSVGGMFVESETLLSPGAQVALKVELRDGGAAVDAQGEVVWVREGASEPPGMALRFVGLDETSTRRIGRVVAAGRREPSALFKRDVRIRLAALPAPLRAVARDQSEEGLILEAELPWLKLGSDVTAELAPGQTRTGRVRWVGLDVTRAGAARLRILVDLAERDRARAPVEWSPEPPAQVARLALAPEPAAEAPPPLAKAPAVEPAAPRAPLEVAPTVPSETARAARPRRLLRNAILALVLVAPALIALWLTTQARPAPALMPPSVVAQPAAARIAPARVELPKEEPAPEPAPAPAAHHRHHHHR